MDKHSGGINWRPFGLDKLFAVSFVERSTLKIEAFATHGEAWETFMAKGRDPKADCVAFHVRPAGFNKGTAAVTLRGDAARAWLGR